MMRIDENTTIIKTNRGLYLLRIKDLQNKQYSMSLLFEAKETLNFKHSLDVKIKDSYLTIATSRNIWIERVGDTERKVKVLRIPVE